MKTHIPKQTLFLICVLILSVAMRVMHIWQYAQLPVFKDIVCADVSEYWNDAQCILHGGKPFSGIHAPLYPYFLAALIGLTANHVFPVRLIQSLLALAADFFLRNALRKRFGDAYTPLCYVPDFAFCFYALSPTLIAMQSEFFAENLSTMLLLACIFLREPAGGEYRTSVRRDVGGVCCGLAILAHPLCVFFPFVIALKTGWQMLADRKHFKSLFRREIFFFLFLVLTVACYIVPRSISAGQFVPVQQGSMFNFWLGNNLEGYGPGICAVPPGDIWHSVHESVADDSEFFARTFQSWKNCLSQGRFTYLLRYALKLVYPVAVCEYTTWSDVSSMHLTWIHRFLYHTSWVLIIPALAAILFFIRARSFRKRCEPLLLLAAAFYLAQAALVSAGRYRMPMLPACAGLAAYLLCAWPLIERKTIWKKKFDALLLASAGISLIGGAPRLDDCNSEKAYATTCLAEAALLAENNAQALAYLLDMPKELQLNLKFRNRICGTFASTFMELGNFDEAAKYLPEPTPTGLPPKDCPPSLLACVGRYYAETERPALAEFCYLNSIEHVDQSQRITTIYNYGVLLQDQGNLEKAKQCYYDALRENPVFVKPWSNLGVIAMREEHYGDAVRYFRTACKLNQDNLRRTVNYAAALVADGQPDEARKVLKPLTSSGNIPDYARELVDSLR